MLYYEGVDESFLDILWTQVTYRHILYSTHGSGRAAGINGEEFYRVWSIFFLFWVLPPVLRHSPIHQIVG